MYRLLRWCAALAVPLIAACTSSGPLTRDFAPPPSFELGGRIAARYQERVFSSALRWKQTAGNDEIWLTAPLGQTIAYLQADAEGATLTAADQKQYRASSLEALTRSALGWRFPVAGLRYWVLGQLAPDMASSAIERDASSRVSRAQQGDFRVAFSYADAGAQRPMRVDIVGGEAEIRLVIDSLTMQQP